MRKVGLQERELWSEAVRDVCPLHPGPMTPAAPQPPGSSIVEPAAPRHPVAQKAPSPDGFLGLDRANAEKLKRGRHKIEARLDLHGMTQAEAFDTLAAFLGRARREGWRCVLVITGRGLASEEGGVLRRAVPRWLQEQVLRPHILAFACAQPRDGGAGALYILLRRNR